MKIILLALACAAHSVAAVPKSAAPRRLDSADLWVTAGAGTYDEMQANCSAAGGHLVVPASEAERKAALDAVKASVHGDVEIWVGYELPSGSDPGTMANYDGENGLTMEEVGYYLWDSNCGKCGKSKSWDRCVHHTTDATGGGTPGYYMATCSGPRPGVCQPPKDLWVTAGTGSYEEMQAACEQGGGHLVVPASEAERLAALAAVQASVHGDVEIWVGYTLPGGSGPGIMANYDGENGLTMEEVGYYLWDSNCGKCGKSKSWDRCVHHTTDATGGGTPGYYMATCSGPRPGVCQGMNSLATSSFNLKGISMDDNRIRTAVAAWLADATVAEATYGHISTWETGEVTDMEELFHRASSFNEDIGAWNTSGVTTMEDMFSWAYAFDQPIGTWSVGAVTNMNRVFEGASAFNQDIGHWPVDSVIDMKKMFSEASAFNQDLSDWRLDSVTDIDRMFYKASAYDQDLGWCVDYGVSIEGAFESSGCESTSCGVTHGICWGRGTNRSGVGLVLVIVICLLLAICVPLAISFCFLAGTGGACIRFCWKKHKKTHMDGVAGAASSVSNSTDTFF